MAAHRPEDQTAFARRLRREMTVAETMLWRALRDRGLAGTKFRRQVPIGPYVADFVCLERRIIVELDGPPHDKPEQQAHDETRDAWLHREGFHVLRFSNDLAIGGTEVLVQRLKAMLADLK